MPKVRLQGARIVALVRTRVAAGVPQHVRKKQKTIEALVRQIEILVRQQPVLMIFEDAHWIDPSSRELLDTTIERYNFWRLQRRAYGATMPNGTPNLQTPLAGTIPHGAVLARPGEAG
jgi:alpha-L-fucosidase